MGRYARLWTAGGPGLVGEASDPLHRHDLLADPAHAALRQELDSAMFDWFAHTPEYRDELQHHW